LQNYVAKNITLLCIFNLMVLSSACTTDRLITRKDHRQSMQQCWQHIADAHVHPGSLSKNLDREILAYQLLIEEVLTEREKSRQLTQWVVENTHDEAIPALYLDKLNRAFTRGLTLSDRVVSVVSRNECWLQANRARIAERGIATLDEYTRYKGFMLAFSATLVLYDSYFTTARILNNNDKIRQFLNQADRGYGKQKDQLEAVTNSIFRHANILLVREEIRFYEKHYADYLSQLKHDPHAIYLTTLIKQSPSYPILNDATIEYVDDQQGVHSNASVSDKFLAFSRQAIGGISKFFGNAVGLIEERKGKLYNHSASHQHLSHRLKAGDILLEKTPFRLTDKMIPGHWGHAAIWVGTENELKELGIWDHPIVVPYHKEISNARLVAEALRSGVELNSLAHFMNIDDVAIIRDPAKSKSETAALIIRTLRQIGKQYDFNYNVETTDKIVCSQLVYLAYTDIKWPTSKLIGRHTISPDNIAIKAIHSGPLELVVLYHDGKFIDDKPVSVMEKLMHQE